MYSPETNFLVAVGSRYEADLIQDTLRDMGFMNVTWVDNGVAAFDLFRQKADFFLLTASDLPQIDGLKLIEMIRRDAQTADAPCVFITSSPKPHELSKAKDMGVSGVWLRPFSSRVVETKLREIMKKRPNVLSPLALESQADKALDSGRPEEAMDEYKQALQAGKKRLAGLHTEMGLAFQKQGRLEEAVASLEEAVEADPRLARAQAALGKAHLDSGRPTEAQQALARAFSLDPKNEETQIDLAESFLQLDQGGRAEEFFKELLQKRPDDYYLLNRMAMALRKQGKFDQALDTYDKAMKINDKDENLHFNIGRCQFEAGRLDLAAVSIRRALGINPRLTQAGKLLARIQQAPDS